MGRIGTNGPSVMETFDNNDDAVSALRRLERMKRWRGYRDCGPSQGGAGKAVTFHNVSYAASDYWRGGFYLELRLCSDTNG
ncbi:WGR domain-containing protein [Pseudaminobacter soli (ex Li et al. 2025)]|uniref:WGR domain-containing protein n=1 Tax=Pseudaminobacter soli (ex Li et al. 2025) TaxID=1295366 RepID=UPI003CD02F7A